MTDETNSEIAMSKAGGFGDLVAWRNTGALAVAICRTMRAGEFSPTILRL
jgi:hypothetical protein